MKYTKMVENNKEESRRKVAIAKREIEILLERKERVTVVTLAKVTGFARSFFYRNPEMKKAIAEAQLQQGECYNPKKVIFDQAAQATIVFLKTSVQQLKKEIELLQKENSELRKKNEALENEISEIKKN